MLNGRELAEVLDCQSNKWRVHFEHGRLPVTSADAIWSIKLCDHHSQCIGKWLHFPFWLPHAWESWRPHAMDLVDIEYSTHLNRTKCQQRTEKVGKSWASNNFIVYPPLILERCARVYRNVQFDSWTVHELWLCTVLDHSLSLSSDDVLLCVAVHGQRSRKRERVSSRKPEKNERKWFESGQDDDRKIYEEDEKNNSEKKWREKNWQKIFIISLNGLNLLVYEVITIWQAYCRAHSTSVDIQSAS